MNSREFALNEGYSVALIARKAEFLDPLVKEIRAAGGDAVALPIETYDYKTIARAFRDVKTHWPEGRLRFACWNTSQWSNIPFLDTTESKPAFSFLSP